MVVGLVRELVRDKIAPRAEGYDRDEAFPWDNIRDINELGLNGVFVPAEYGGSPMSYACYLTLVKEISQGCGSTGVIWATNFHAIGPVLDFGTAEQKRRFGSVIANGGLGALVITEATGGSDATQMRTSFRPDRDDIVVNGNKIFITSGDVADLYLLFGKWHGIEDPRKAISTLVLEKDTPGLRVGRKEQKLGHRASSTVELIFEDARVPRANLLGEPGQGLRILFSTLNKSRPSVAAQALGIAEAAFQEAVGYINQRVAFGRRIVEFQGIQFMVADMAAKLAMTEAWLYHVARLVDGGTADVAVEASILKLSASDLAMEIASNAVQLHGGYGYMKGARVERLFRDAKLTQIWEGTNQIQRVQIGRAFIERKADG
ncbi:MAG: acyl-CoA dehydrogenase family protein [Chloroflexi bacterium]|nr:acyl-CoA dehydrogenase family protein [Chloroflexota bacterium]